MYSTAGELYLSIFDLIDKALRFPDKWEHKLMAIGGYVGGRCVDCEIKRGPKIVNGIANHERPCVGDGFISFRNDQILASLRPVFDNQPKWTAFHEFFDCKPQLVDMLLGSPNF